LAHAVSSSAVPKRLWRIELSNAGRTWYHDVGASIGATAAIFFLLGKEKQHRQRGDGKEEREGWRREKKETIVDTDVSFFLFLISFPSPSSFSFFFLPSQAARRKGKKF
jgi:hypothetical protein